MITDSLGHEIQVNDDVIYNLSGELALGRIISLASKKRKGWIDYTEYTIKVQHIQGGNRPKDGTSTVRNPKGIVVLKGLAK